MPVPIPSLARSCISFVVRFKKAWTKEENDIKEGRKEKGKGKEKERKKEHLISDIIKSKEVKKLGEKKGRITIQKEWRGRKGPRCSSPRAFG